MGKGEGKYGRADDKAEGKANWTGRKGRERGKDQWQVS